MISKTVVLITGANRGIGKGFIELYLARPNHIVIAANRDPEHHTSKALANFFKGPGSSLIVLKIDATSQTDPAQAVKQLESQGIGHIDILVANAGISQCWPKVSEVDVQDMQKHLVPNVYGVIWLYQAFLPLLNKSATPKWVSIGSSAAMLTEMAARPMPNAAYGPTKVILHWLTAKMHFEEPKLITLPMDPG
jgi:NAD(P)-dependent dehydrogenase (short-subunit alcohol dehydrogenase family)